VKKVLMIGLAYYQVMGCLDHPVAPAVWAAAAKRGMFERQA